MSATTSKMHAVVSTDPPYYDNIPYADLSEFFYVWLRRSLKAIFPDLFATLAVPKAEELVAFAHRHDGKEAAEAFFLNGMTQAMHRLAEQSHPAFPVTIYYAFKQSETEGEGTASTGWETFLDAVIPAGFALGGTWPMRTERPGRMREYGSNALASSILLVCRPHDAAGILASKAGKVRLLKPNELLEGWDPATDTRLTVWEMVHQLIRVLEQWGEAAAAQLLAALGAKAEAARELAYRLYTVCERKKRAPEALSYNALVQSWPEIARLPRGTDRPTEEQIQMFEQE
jgi:adenine-specific DNA methylase